MDALIKTFHIDYKILIAQLVNFGIVFGVLWYFALKPIMKIMQERTRTIEKSLDDAKKIDENLKQSQKEYQAHIAKAKQEAAIVLEDAQKESVEQKKIMVKNAKEEIEKLVKEAKQHIHDEKQQMIHEAEKEISQLVMLSLEKILGKTISKKVDNEIIKDSLKVIKL